MIRALWILIGGALLVLPLLPLPAWTGAFDTGPVWGANLSSWGIGLLVVLVTAALAGRLSKDSRFDLSRLVPQSGSHTGRYVPMVAVLALLLATAAAVTMQEVFAGNPQLVDEMAQLFHARIFATGRLAADPPPHPQFFLLTHTMITDHGWMSQYPPGQTVLLALGWLLHAAWLVNPILGGAGVVLVFLIARGLYDETTGAIAAVLWALSAWVLFMSSTYLNHVGAVTLSMAAWALVFGPRKQSIMLQLLAGAAVAAVAATRPLDAVAAAMPIGVWILMRREFKSIAWFTLGGIPILVAWGYVNWRLFGSPVTMGYTVLYGPEHNLGFHVDPYGDSFTPLIALSNMAVAIRRLHIYAYEWPIPALLPLGVWALLGKQRTRSDLLLGVGLIAAPVCYFFYWHSGFYLGPRFYYAIAPFIAIGTARAALWVFEEARRRVSPHFRADLAALTLGAVVILWGSVSVLPMRFKSYATGLPTFKLHPERELKARGLDKALVLIPESFGSRVVTALWDLGVPAGLVEQAYRRVDTCVLDESVQESRAKGYGPEQVQFLIRQLIDQNPVAVEPVSDAPDPTLRISRNHRLSEHCRNGIRRDLTGFTLYGFIGWRNPLDLKSGIIFARDLYEQNLELLTEYQGWPLWRFAPPPGDPNGLPVLTHLGVVRVGK